MLDQWHEFFIMVGGAAAVLAGLVFVGISLNPNIIIIPIASSPKPHAYLPITSALSKIAPKIIGPKDAEAFPLMDVKPKYSPNFSLGEILVTMIRLAVQVPPKAGPAIIPIIILSTKG